MKLGVSLCELRHNRHRDARPSIATEVMDAQVHVKANSYLIPVHFKAIGYESFASIPRAQKIAYNTIINPPLLFSLLVSYATDT